MSNSSTYSTLLNYLNLLKRDLNRVESRYEPKSTKILYLQSQIEAVQLRMDNFLQESLAKMQYHQSCIK